MIQFRRLQCDDLPLLHRWMNEDPVINQIWSHGKLQSIDEIGRKYGARINGEKPTDPYLILYDGLPIGYIQTYFWRDYPGYEAYVDLQGAASLDLFIGEAAYRNRGLGRELLSRFLWDHVFAKPGAASCVITPEAANLGAIRAYAKAGFHHVATVPDIPGEPGPVYFMRITRSEVKRPLERLAPQQYSALRPVIRDEHEFVCVTMASLRGDGEFWVDDPDSPSVVIGLLPKDTFVWGDLSHWEVRTLLARAAGLVADAPGLEPLLREVWGTYERLPSVEYRYAGAEVPPPPVPEGFRLTAVGPEHLRQLIDYRPWYGTSRTIGDFAGYEDFFANGYGYAVIDEATGKIASACMAHAVSPRRADHSLRTLPEYRHRGLAVACTHATIMEGVRRGLDPVWITTVDNAGSRAIAARIGLKLCAEYTLFERAEN